MKKISLLFLLIGRFIIRC